MNTIKQLLEAKAAIEHDDLTGLYDNISIDGAIEAIIEWLTEENQDFEDKNIDDEPRFFVIDKLILDCIKEQETKP
jgi:hypothetical protein